MGSLIATFSDTVFLHQESIRKGLYHGLFEFAFADISFMEFLHLGYPSTAILSNPSASSAKKAA